jgi:antitoxin CptB
VSVKPAPSVSELRWRCRRGMLELDIMLNAYLDARGGKMSGEELMVFEKLLAYPDQVLQGLLVGTAESADADIMGVVDGVREVVRQQRGVAAQ